MRCCVFMILFLLFLGGLGLPLFELSMKADDVLRMALNQINAHYAKNHLYRVSKASVTRIVPLGMNTYDLHLRFGIRETDCQKIPGVDPQDCMYRKGFYVLEAGCYSRGRVTQSVTRVISLRCTKAESSSSESSEEGRLGLHYELNHFWPGEHIHSTLVPSINMAPPLHMGHQDKRGTSQVPRDSFNNHLPYE